MGLSIKQQNYDSLKESLDPNNVKRDTKLHSKKNSFIVEAETVNTESTNIIIPSTSITDAVLNPIINGNEQIDNDNNHNVNEDDDTILKSNLLTYNNRQSLISKDEIVNVSKDLSSSSSSPSLPPPSSLLSDDKYNNLLPLPCNNSTENNNNNNDNDNDNVENANSVDRLSTTTTTIESPSISNNNNNNNNTNNNNNNLGNWNILSKDMINDTSKIPAASKSDSNDLENRDKLNIDKSIDPRPVSKIIERPTIPTTNSRDLLLTDNKKVNENLNDTDNSTNKNVNITDDNDSDDRNNRTGSDIAGIKNDATTTTTPIINNNNSSSNNSKSTSSSGNRKIPIDKNIILESKISKDNNIKPCENQDYDRKLNGDDTSIINIDETDEDNNNNNNQKPNKTEFFAARLATAVDENEISDSEETFVYESASNSIKNLIYPSNSSIGPLNIQINDHRSTSHSYDIKDGSIANKNHGISTKMSVPLLNTNKKLINRLKNTRHTSTSGILNHSTVHDPIGSAAGISHFTQGYKPNNAPNITSNLNTDANPGNITTFHPTSTLDSTISSRKKSNSGDNNNNNKASTGNDSKMKNSINAANATYPLNQSCIPANVDDIPSIRSIHNLDRHNDRQSMKSLVIEQFQSRSPDKRLSTLSLTRLPPGNISNLPVGSLQKQPMIKNGNSTKVGNDTNNNTKAKSNENKRVLRTTVSKIFDSTRTPLRRYSGVPDNVNLEDYIEQADELNGAESMKYDMGVKYHNMSKYNNDKYMEHYNSNKEEGKEKSSDSKRLSVESHNSINWNTSPGLYHHSTSAIQEEDENESHNNSNNNVNNSDGANEYVMKKSSIIKNSDFNDIGNNLNNENASQFYKDSIHMNNIDDDVHSTFYYNHRSDLEARPEISDYEDDDMDPDGEYGLCSEPGHYESHPNVSQSQILYYGKNSSNNKKKVQLQGNSINRNSSYYEYGYPNEYTPLRYSARKRMSRNQLNFSPHDFAIKKSRLTRFKNGLYYIVLMLLLLFIGFLFGFILATNKDLQDFNVVLLDNVISSAEELIFDITVSSFNPGFFTITINSLDVAVFAKSESVLKTEALFLGSIDEMEIPLKFAGGFFNRRYAASTTALKVVSPGNSSFSDSMKWRKVIQNDYELVLRGTMKYSIPFFGNSRSVNVQHSATVSGHKSEMESGPIFTTMTNIL